MEFFLYSHRITYVLKGVASHTHTHAHSYTFTCTNTTTNTHTKYPSRKHVKNKGSQKFDDKKACSKAISFVGGNHIIHQDSPADSLNVCRGKPSVERKKR